MPLTINQLTTKLVQIKEPNKISVVVGLFELYLCSLKDNQSTKAKCTVILSLLIKDLDAKQAERLSKIGIKYMNEEDKQDDMLSGVGSDNQVVVLAWMVVNQYYDLASYIISEYQYLLGYLLEFEPFERLTEFFEYLSKNNKDFLAILNHKNSEIITPLHMAVFNNKLDFVKLCLQYGANLYEHDKHGESVIALAISINNPSMIKLLYEVHLERGSTIEYDQSLCRGAIQRGQLEEVKQIINFYQSKNKPFINELVEDSTLLMSVIRHTSKLEELGNHLEAIEYLLTCGVDLLTIDSTGKDVLFHLVFDKTIHPSVMNTILNHYFTGDIDINYLVELFAIGCEHGSLFLAGEIWKRKVDQGFVQLLIEHSEQYEIDLSVICKMIKSILDYSLLDPEQVSFIKKELSRPIFSEASVTPKKSKKRKSKKKSRASSSNKPKDLPKPQTQVCSVAEEKVEPGVQLTDGVDDADCVVKELASEFIQIADDLMLTDKVAAQEIRTFITQHDLVDRHIIAFDNEIQRRYKLSFTNAGVADLGGLISSIILRRRDRQFRFQSKVDGVIDQFACVLKGIDVGVKRQLAMSQIDEILQAIPKTTYAYCLFYNAACKQFGLQDVRTEEDDFSQCLSLLKNCVATYYTRINQAKFDAGYIPGHFCRWMQGLHTQPRSHSEPTVQSPLSLVDADQRVRPASSQNLSNALFFRPISPALSKGERCESIESKETNEVVDFSPEKTIEKVRVFLDLTASKVFILTDVSHAEFEIEGEDLTLQVYMMQKTLLRQRDMLSSPKQRSSDAEFPRFQASLEFDPGSFEMRLLIDDRIFSCQRKEAIHVDGMVYYPSPAK